MDYIGFLTESFSGSISSVGKMAIIIIPLMIVMEILKDSKILEKISQRLMPIAKLFGISNEAVFPIIIGLIFGLAYGAGIIIENAKENDLSKKDLYIMIIFLIACHAVIEDTVVLMAVGANGVLLISIRVIVAVIITLIASRVFNKLNIE